MKKYILIILALASLSLHAQGTKLNLEVIPGKLATQLTEEQMSTITELTLTGEMYNCDFYTIRDKMKVLEKLDLKNILADSIPDKAFYNNMCVNEIILSKVTTYIGDEAFSKCNLESITFTGKFPQLGNYIWGKDIPFRDFDILVSEDNMYCSMINNCIYSSDMKTLYLATQFNGSEINGYEILDGTEIIGKGAFEYTIARSGLAINIPSSVVEIQAYAFSTIYINMPTGGTHSTALSFYCEALIPPTLKENVFNRMEGADLQYELGVPKESIELYLNSTAWNQSFNNIYAISNTPPSCLKASKYQSIVSFDSDIIHIQSDKIISEVYLSNLQGIIIQHIKPYNNTIALKYSRKKNIYYLYLHYNNGETEFIKIISK